MIYEIDLLGSPVTNYSPMGLVEWDNTQKMIRNDLDRETRCSAIGWWCWGTSATVFPYAPRYDTIRIFARTVGERDPGGGGLSWGKHRVTTRGWARVPPRPPVLAYDSINILLARHSTLLRRTIEWHAGLGGSYSLDTREKRESYWFIAFDVDACKCIF